MSTHLGKSRSLSNVYSWSFSTIFYEFIACDFPFAKQSSDAIIWQVGVGIKPPLGNMNVSREAKVGSISILNSFQ